MVMILESLDLYKKDHHTLFHLIGEKSIIVDFKMRR